MGCTSSSSTAVTSADTSRAPTGSGAGSGAGGGAGAGAGGRGAMGGHTLRTLEPYVFDGDISKFQLQCMREEFWEKAKTAAGSSQVWDALKVACESLCNGSHELAETVLQSAGITTANGTLSVCFDHRRQKYAIPRYCWSTPVNMRDGVVNSLAAGKTEEHASEPLSVSVRIAHTEQTLKLMVTTLSTIANLKQAVNEELRRIKPDDAGSKYDEMEPDRQRMFFGGRELRDEYTLASCGVKAKCVVQVAGRPTEAEAKEFAERYNLRPGR